MRINKKQLPTKGFDTGKNEIFIFVEHSTKTSDMKSSFLSLKKMISQKFFPAANFSQ